MTNKEIGQTFFQVAKVLELGDPADRFRVIAYERAAQIIENYGEDLGIIYRKGGVKALTEIPGVGKSIAEKIEELIKTGKLKYLAEIQKNVPVSQVELIKIPGIGAKTAIKISQELKVTSIEDLEQKIKEGKADKIFKEKTRANILRGMEIMRRLTGRMLLTEALPIAEKVVSYLKKNTPVKKVDFVGSLRRMKETIGDIDIVAATDKPKEVVEAFIKMPGIVNILAQGPNKGMVIFEPNAHIDTSTTLSVNPEGNRRIDLEIVSEKEYGSLLQHLTGSKDHNVALRAYALTINRSVSEHGLKILKEGKVKSRILCSNEECVYRNLKMAWIPPELREDRGEIKAALNYRLPKLIDSKDIRGDLHVHSNWSDSFITVEEIAKKAIALGYEYIVISDHTVGLGIAGGLDERRLEARQKEIEKIQKKYPKIKLLSSVEVNIKANGDLDIKDWMLKKLDLVTASIHTSFFQDRQTMTDRLIKAINHPHVDIIGHPSGRIIGQREPYEVDWPKVFINCAKTGTALEISAFPNRLDLKDTLCKEAKSYGVKFAISTDAHQTQHLELMRFGVAVARRGWLEKEDVINTRGLKELLAWAKR